MKIGAAALLATLLALLLKQSQPALALTLSIAVAAGLGIFIFSAFAPIGAFIERVAGLSNLSGELVAPVLKVACLSILVKLIASLCRDGGESSLAGAVETAGAVLAVLFVLPLLNTVLDLCLRLI